MKKVLKSSLLSLMSASMVWTVTAGASEKKMAPAEVAYAQEALHIVVGARDTRDLSQPAVFVDAVREIVNHSWKDHAKVVHRVAQELRAGETFDEKKTIASLHLLRNTIAGLGLDYAPPINEEAINEAPHVVCCLPPMNGLNALCALKWMQSLLAKNNSVHAMIVDQGIPHIITDHNELVSLVRRIGLNVESIPLAMPNDSEALYKWAAPIILGGVRSVSVIPSEQRNMPAAMKAFKDAQGKTQYLYFVAEGKQGEEHRNAIFGDQENVQVITVAPPVDVKHDFYRKRYKAEEDLEYALDGVLAALTDLQRRALSLSQSGS